MPKGQILNPHIPHNVKCGTGFNHKRTGALLCPAGLDWNNLEYFFSLLFYKHSWYLHFEDVCQANEWSDSGCGWPVACLFVCKLYILCRRPVERTTSEWPTHFGESPIPFLLLLYNYYKQAFKHVFTSPSSVDQELKATWSGNAHIHGMQCVTKASIAYVATQVHIVSPWIITRTEW